MGRQFVHRVLQEKSTEINNLDKGEQVVPSTGIDVFTPIRATESGQITIICTPGQTRDEIMNQIHKAVNERLKESMDEHIAELQSKLDESQAENNDLMQKLDMALIGLRYYHNENAWAHEAQSDDGKGQLYFNRQDHVMNKSNRHYVGGKVAGQAIKRIING